MTIIEAMTDALTMLESNGYKGGDVHDYLVAAISRLKAHYPAAAEAELEEIL